MIDPDGRVAWAADGEQPDALLRQQLARAARQGRRRRPLRRPALPFVHDEIPRVRWWPRPWSPREDVKRPADPAVRRAHGRRIVKLFQPYGAKLAFVGVLIVVSSASASSRRSCSATSSTPRSRSGARPGAVDMQLLTVLAGGMIAIAIVTGAFGVVQSLHLDAGRPERDARPAHRGLPAPPAALARVLHAHAHRRGAEPDRERHRRRRQRRSPRRRPRSSRTVTTVIAIVIAMFLLDWRLAALRARADAAVRVDDAPRRRAAAQDRDGAPAVDGRHLLARPGVALGLRDPAREDDGPLAGARRPVRGRVAAGWPTLEVQQPDDRPLDDGVDPDDLRDHAGGRLLVRRLRDRRTARPSITIGTLVAFTTLQTRLFAPIGQLLSISIDVQTSLALFDRIFEYLDLRVDIEEGDARGDTACAATSGSRTSGSATRATTGRCEAIDIDVPAGTKTAIVGETGAGQDDARLPRRAALRRRRRGAVSIDGVDVRELTFAVARGRGRRRLAGDVPLQRERARQPALREARRDRRARSRRPRARRRSTT